MTSLSDQEKQLLFDYCIGLASEQQAEQAKTLISSNEEAANIYSRLKSILSLLDSAMPEPCPDELAEQTILRINELARPSRLQSEQLPTIKRRRVIRKVKLWTSISRVAAIAAVLALLVSIFITPLNVARQKSWQQRCQMQLRRIFQGLSNYISDHDGQLPMVAMTNGSPWWKVGYQGKENQSNTRNLWLLVKGNYTNPRHFVCPGKRQGQPIRFDIPQINNYNDFPARRYINYSLRIRCNKTLRECITGQRVLMSDLNPLFEKLPDDHSKSLKLQLNGDLLTLNSINHNRMGQNVLFGDGRVDFVKVRHIGIGGDDIFTLQGTKIYEGNEVPSCETDAFLAP